jgi:hypothetical protein
VLRVDAGRGRPRQEENFLAPALALEGSVSIPEGDVFAL